MPVSFLFWLLMILWAIFGVGFGFRTANGNYIMAGGNVLLFVLLFLLGWSVYGGLVFTK